MKSGVFQTRSKLQNGQITSVRQVEGTNNGQPFIHMEIHFQLDAKDSSGKPYELVKSYNIGGNGRGINLFLADYKSMSGIQMDRTDLYTFDPESMVNSRFAVDVGYQATGKEVKAVIRSFLPATEQVAS